MTDPRNDDAIDGAQHPVADDSATPEVPINMWPQEVAANRETSEAEPSDEATPLHAKRKPVALIAGVAALSLLFGGLGGGLAGTAIAAHENDDSSSISGSTNSGADSGFRTTTATPVSNLSTVVQRAMRSVVTISVQGDSGSGTGSGIVLNDQGYIVTNAHVVTLEGQTKTGKLTVLTSTGDIYSASLVGYDSTSDSAVIKIVAGAKGIEPITFANSDDVKVGDTTIAIGSPLGLSGTVTTGTVSAAARPISVASSEVGGSQSTSVSLNSIQTDAAINSGNSGGALLNANGALIGMNDAIATSGSSSGSIGIGFSIPANNVKRVANELIKDGKATHGRLGAVVSNGSQTNSVFTVGARLVSVDANTAASRAGLRANDLVTKFGNVVITDATQLTALIKERAPGDKVQLTYKRGDAVRTITVTLGS